MTKQEKIFRALDLATGAYKDIQRDHDLVIALDSGQTGVQCFIRRQGPQLFIAFRGSNEWKDWQKNLSFWKMTIPYENGRSSIRVHSGFITAYKHPSVRDILQAHVTDEIRSVTITGHSYGAALSVLCAVDLEYNFPTLEYEVYLFGGPRVGNKAFMRSYNKRVFNTIRIENGNDIVTKVPFAWMGFRHVGAKMHIGPPRIPGVFSAARHWQVDYYQSLLKRLLP